MDLLPQGRLAVNQLPGGVLHPKSKTTKGHPYPHIRTSAHTCTIKVVCHKGAHAGTLSSMH